MAPYATEDDFTVPAAALTRFSLEEKEDAISKACAFADGYLNSRFRLPLTTFGGDLTDCVAAIATYKLMMKRGMAPTSGDNTELYNRYKDAVSWLKDVVAGKVTPTNVADSGAGEADTDPSGEASEGPMVLQSQPSRDSLADFWGHGSSSPGGVGTPRNRGW